MSSRSRSPVINEDPWFGTGDINENSSTQVSQEVETNNDSFLSQFREKGLSTLGASAFIFAEMSGSGVLALPYALENTGWIGALLLLVFGINAGYSGSRLGICWEMLEERYHEHRDPTRNPYATIGYRAIGIWGRRLVTFCIQFTLFGVCTVYTLLASEMIQELLRKIFPDVSFCVWFLIIAAFLLFPMWLGTPKDFFLIGVTAMILSLLSCLFIVLQIIIDGYNISEFPNRKELTWQNFFISSGSLLFAYGGASAFPTIQNDMKVKKNFTKSVALAFIGMIAFYLPISLGGFLVYGENIQPNIILSLSKSGLTTLANLCMIIHLILALLIIINPATQEIEELLAVPHNFNWKRCLVRTFALLLIVFVGETIPNFGKILSLIGGSTVTMLTFVFPPFFYMKLCEQKNENWPERSIPFFVKIYLWELIIVGILGGIATTYSGVKDMTGMDSLITPCYLS